MGHSQTSVGKLMPKDVQDPGGVVRRTPANNRAGNNQGGVGDMKGTAVPGARPNPGGRVIVGTKGRTVAGTNRTIASGGK